MNKFLIVFSCLMPDGNKFNGNYMCKLEEIDEDKINKITSEKIPESFKKQYPGYVDFDYQVIILNIIKLEEVQEDEEMQEGITDNTQDIKYTKGRKYMPIKEFRQKGFLQELNRRFLHVLGLAISVRVNEDTGEEEFEGVWDYRDNKEGLFYDRDKMQSDDFQRKVDYVRQELTKKGKVRKEKYGEIVQSLKNKSDKKES